MENLELVEPTVNDLVSEFEIAEVLWKHQYLGSLAPLVVIGEVVSLLVQASNKNVLHSWIEHEGKHSLEDLAMDIAAASLKNGSWDNFSGYISEAGEAGVGVIKEAIEGWCKLKIGTNEEAEEWIETEECRNLRKLSLKAAMILVQFLPLAIDGKIVWFQDSQRGPLIVARRRAAERSEWGLSILEEIP